MKVGNFNRKILIEQPVAGVDPVYGSPTITWTALATIWAEVQDALPSRAESVVQGLTVAKNQVRVRFHFRLDVTSAMRITELEPPYRVLQIVGGPATVGNREETEVMCEQIL